MHAAAHVLVGRHDFSAFRAAECQARSPIKTLDVLDVTRDGEEIEITAQARSFLHNQVRAMVGTLALVGEGRWTREDVSQALAARDRSRGGPTAPPCGLYLVAALVLGLGYAAFSAGFAWRATRFTARGVLFSSLLYLPLILSVALFDPVVQSLIQSS